MFQQRNKNDDQNRGGMSLGLGLKAWAYKSQYLHEESAWLNELHSLAYEKALVKVWCFAIKGLRVRSGYLVGSGSARAQTLQAQVQLGPKKSGSIHSKFEIEHDLFFRRTNFRAREQREVELKMLRMVFIKMAKMRKRSWNRSTSQFLATFAPLVAALVLDVVCFVMHQLIFY